MTTWKSIAGVVLGAAICVGCVTVASTGTAAAEKPSPEEALAKLKEGNARFVTGESTFPNTSSDRRALAGGADQGDYAYATILSCADSRVPVEMIFDSGVMDLFVIREAGNVADTNEIGTIEYGLGYVHTPVLVVMGHSGCGAVAAVKGVLEGSDAKFERNIPPLVDTIIPAVQETLEAHADASDEDKLNAAIEANVWKQMYDIFLESPAVRDHIDSGKVVAVGAVYDIGSGEVKWLDMDKPGQLLAKAKEDPERATEKFAQ